jgi:hypothetical protein
MNQESGFTPEEWQTLQFAPFWIFSAILGAYRNFDPLEYEAFWRSLDEASSAPGLLTQEIITSVMMEGGQLTEKYQTDSRTIARGLCAVAAILGKAPVDEADMFKDTLISRVGVGVAKARGRFGRVMSKDDEKTLELISQFLF